MIKDGQNGVFLENDENMVSDHVFGGFSGDPKNGHFSAFYAIYDVINVYVNVLMLKLHVNDAWNHEIDSM